MADYILFGSNVNGSLNLWSRTRKASTYSDIRRGADRADRRKTVLVDKRAALMVGKDRESPAFPTSTAGCCGLGGPGGQLCMRQHSSWCFTCGAKGIRTPPLTRQNTGSLADSLRLVPIVPTRYLGFCSRVLTASRGRGDEARHAALYHRVEPDVRGDAVPDVPHSVFRDGRNLKVSWMRCGWSRWLRKQCHAVPPRREQLELATCAPALR